MKKYLLRRNGRILGPFPLEVLNLMEIYASDMLCEPADNNKWLPPEMVDGLENYIIHEAEPGEIPVVAGEKPVDGDETAKEPIKSNHDWLKKLRFQLGVFKPATLFFLLIFSTLFAKLAIDSVVDYEYYQKTSMAMVDQPQPPLQYVHDALVKKYFKPSDTVASTWLEPGRPSDIFRDVSVKGKIVPSGNLDPAALLLEIKNNSLYLVDHAEVEVEYNDDKNVIGRHSFKISGLRPKATKSLSVPVEHANATISYKILNIYTSQYTSLTRDI